MTLSQADEISIRLYLNKHRRGFRYTEGRKSRFIKQAAADLSVDAFSVRWVMNSILLENEAYALNAPVELPLAQGDAPWAELRAAMNGDRRWRK
jgi:hypothetical protein